MPQYELEGCVALVTGASAGLGEQFAHGLAESGADLVLAARRIDLLEQIAADLRERHGVRAIAVKTDVSREQDIVRAVGAAVETFGQLDVLVNNAGTLVAKPVLDHTLSDWNHVMETNLTSVFLASREAARVMVTRRSGSIINISSIFGFGATREFAEVGYYASKGGMIALTKALSVELGDYGIRVNAIAPGFFPTDMGKDISDELRAKLIEPRTCLETRPDISWIRGAVCFLASRDSRWMTGSTVTVDGGWMAF